MYIKDHMEGNKTQFLATSSGDIAKLPTSTEEGTGGKAVGDNAKCALGSTCVLADGSTTEVYILDPTDHWVVM